MSALARRPGGAIGAAVHVVLAGAVLVAALASCDDRDGNERVPAAAEAATETLFVVGSGTSIGDGLPDGLRQAWPRVLFAESFPRSTVLVNGALGATTVADAVVEQVPVAAEIEPDTAAVLIGTYDIDQETPVARFAADFRQLLAGLQDSGVQRLLVATLPQLPAYDETLRVDYNAAIVAAVDVAGATLVDLAPLRLTAIDEDADFQPDVGGQRAIAEAFGRALDE